MANLKDLRYYVDGERADAQVFNRPLGDIKDNLVLINDEVHDLIYGVDLYNQDLNLLDTPGKYNIFGETTNKPNNTANISQVIIYKTTNDSVQIAYDSDNQISYIRYNLKAWRPLGSSGTVTDGLTNINIVSPNNGEILVYNSSNGNWENSVLSNSFDNLDKINIGNPSNGEVLTYNNISGKWENKAPVSDVSSGSSDLDGLTDTSLTTVKNAQVLMFNSSSLKWENGDLNIPDGGVTSLDGLTDVTLYGSPAEGEFLKFNSNGKWQNQTVTIPDTLVSLADTNIGSVQDGHVLQYQNGKWVNGVITSGGSGGTYSAGTGILINGSTISHSVLSSINSNNSNGVVLQDIAVNNLGHVTTVGTIDLDNRYVQITNASNHTHSQYALTNHTHSLKDLSDVSTASPSSNQVLTWDGSSWAPSTPASGGGSTYSAGNGIIISGTTISHSNLSSINSNNSNGIVLQDIAVNTQGHVTSVGTTNLDNRYSLTSHTHSGYALTNHTHSQYVPNTATSSTFKVNQGISRFQISNTSGEAHAFDVSNTSTSTYGVGIHGYVIGSDGIGVAGIAYDGFGVSGFYRDPSGSYPYGRLGTSSYSVYGSGGPMKCVDGFSTFTGVHFGLDLDECLVGDIVYTNDAILLDVNDSIPLVKATSIINDKRVIGVVQKNHSHNKLDDMFKGYPSLYTFKDKDSKWTEFGNKIKETYKDYNDISINALGEGGINVCDANGDILNGDYITSSNIPGKGMKQESEFMANYTVGKSLKDIIWADEIVGKDGCFEQDGAKCKMISCTYHCG